MSWWIEPLTLSIIAGVLFVFYMFVLSLIYNFPIIVEKIKEKIDGLQHK